MQFGGFWCNEYESGYESEYGGVYDQNFVFYDEEEIDVDDDELVPDQDDDSEDDEYDSDFEDVILEEIPFVHCPAKGEAGEA